MRRIVAARARGYCEYCRCSEQFATESFTVEHIKPRQAGGETVLENLAWSCFGCNAHKHAKTQAIDLETGEKIALYNPRLQVWSEHFGWSDDFTQVIVDILTALKGTVIPKIALWASSFYDSAYLEEFPHPNRGRCLQRRDFPYALRYAILVLICCEQRSNLDLVYAHNEYKRES
jgi:hypothetical protein